jgi:hypothetical protein
MAVIANWAICGALSLLLVKRSKHGSKGYVLTNTAIILQSNRYESMSLGAPSSSPQMLDTPIASKWLLRSDMRTCRIGGTMMPCRHRHRDLVDSPSELPDSLFAKADKAAVMVVATLPTRLSRLIMSQQATFDTKISLLSFSHSYIIFNNHTKVLYQILRITWAMRYSRYILD